MGESLAVGCFYPLGHLGLVALEIRSFQCIHDFDIFGKQVSNWTCSMVIGFNTHLWSDAGSHCPGVLTHETGLLDTSSSHKKYSGV